MEQPPSSPRVNRGSWPGSLGLGDPASTAHDPAGQGGAGGPRRKAPASPVRWPEGAGSWGEAASPQAAGEVPESLGRVLCWLGALSCAVPSALLR